MVTESSPEVERAADGWPDAGIQGGGPANLPVFLLLAILWAFSPALKKNSEVKYLACWRSEPTW